MVNRRHARIIEEDGVLAVTLCRPETLDPIRSTVTAMLWESTPVHVGVGTPASGHRLSPGAADRDVPFRERRASRR